MYFKIMNSAEPWEFKTLWRGKLNHKSWLSQNNLGETGHGEGKGGDRTPHSNIFGEGLLEGMVQPLKMRGQAHS